MTQECKFSCTTTYIVEVTPGEYLTYIGGDWGPDHSTTTDYSKAVQVDSSRGAEDYCWRHYSRDRKPYRICKMVVTETYTLID